jgi:cytochrome c oxidase subunit II
MTNGSNPGPAIPKATLVPILVAVALTVLFVAATRIYEFELPLWQRLVVNGETNPDTLHLSGEFVENNLGTAREADGSYTLRLIAQQYVFVPHCVRIPAGTPIRIRITSADGAHTLTVAGLDYKAKVVPGVVSQNLLQIPQPGVYPLPCSEFCGSGHFAMIARLEVVPANQFPNLGPTDRTTCATP